MTRVALVGAAGKMGTRISRNLARAPEYETLYCEKGEVGVARLRERGTTPTAPEEAVALADVSILAVPDVAMRSVTAALVPLARPGSTILMLDPAAAAAGEVTLRDDLTFVVCHPCHPPLFGEQPT
ncbi:MAG: NAD(P)-binding domain-containing protein, partial [Armatimonadota bacterium]|nr:NAD(P)-binding domain-containing protein [Armatimonadota bacterium]